MISLSVKVGQAVEIGDAACVKVDWKSGQSVRLIIATKHAVKVLANGLIPAKFTPGISGLAPEVERTFFRDVRKA